MNRMLAATLACLTIATGGAVAHAGSLRDGPARWGSAPHAPALQVAAGGKAAGDACAAKLPAESRLIYDATVRNLGSAATIRDVVTEQTRALVMQGKVQMSTAKTSAEATAPCLELVAKG